LSHFTPTRSFAGCSEFGGGAGRESAFSGIAKTILDGLSIDSIMIELHPTSERVVAEIARFLVNLRELI
jgi:hypothetical protein